MPRRDGTGPMGDGTMTGRGMGFCNNKHTFRQQGLGFGARLGYGCRRGFGNGYFSSSKTEKEFLEEQRDFLNNQLEIINKQLDNISE